MAPLHQSLLFWRKITHDTVVGNACPFHIRLSFGISHKAFIFVIFIAVDKSVRDGPVELAKALIIQAPHAPGVVACHEVNIPGAGE